MEEKLSAKEIKKIIKDITNSESKKYGIDIKLCPLSFVDIVNSSFVNGTKYTVVRRISDYVEYLNYNGYNDLKGNAVVFVDKLANESINYLVKLYAKEVSYDIVQQYNIALGRNTEYLRKVAERGNGYFNKYDGAMVRGLFQVLKTSYHEIRHSVQLTFNKYSYERFLRDVEDFFIKCDLGRDYKYNHDSYSFEIGANLYGTRMAKEYLMNNYPLIYEKDKGIIELIEKRYMDDYLLYNPSYTIDKVLPRIRMLNPFGDNEIVKYDFIKDTSPVLGIFLNGDGSFKRPSEVLANEKYQSLDKRIVYAFFSSELFIKELGNIKDLTSEEVSMLNEAMDYTNEVCRVQMRYYNDEISAMGEPSNYFERQKMRLIYMRSFFSKYEYVKRYLDSLKENKEIINGKSK